MDKELTGLLSRLGNAQLELETELADCKAKLTELETLSTICPKCDYDLRRSL